MVLYLKLIGIVIGLITAGYLFILHRNKYFKRLRIPFVEPTIPRGNVKGKFLFDIQQIYNKFKNNSKPLFGVFIWTNPIIVIKDLELIKQILVKDFMKFPERGQYTNPKDDPLSNHLFNMDSHGWKEQRAKLSPTFSSGKMKFMFSTVVDIADRFKDTLNELIDNSKSDIYELEMKDLLARYTTDVIGNVAFGVECNSLKDPNSVFRERGREITDLITDNIVLKIIRSDFKSLARMLKVKVSSTKQINFFRNLIQQTIKTRESSNIRRNDFMDLLLDVGKNTNEKGFTLEQIMAHTYVFFIAGFETSSTTMSFALYELTQNQKIQNKVRKEINDVIKKYDGKITYEALTDMVYLEQIISETLRKYPPVTMLNRKCVEDFEVPYTDIVIRKGNSVMIPVYALQRDSEYYPNPEVFNPDNFTPEAMKDRHPMTFLSFGDGPRNCIGLRFGRMQTKIGMVLLLQNFQFFAGDKLDVPIKINPNSVIIKSDEGLWLKVKKI